LKSYTTNIFLRNGHLNTIFPVIFRRHKSPAYQRERLTTEDNDFIDIDFIKSGHKRIAVLCHGLEGSSHSNYIIGTGGLLSENGWDVAAVNHRSCSGEMNLQKRMYHSGATDDLGFIINSIIEDYDEVVLIGFSLGGNMSLKYCGEQSKGIDDKIKAVVGISVPTDLKGGSIHIGKPANFIYERKFMKSLKEKMMIKAKRFPEDIDINKLKGLKKLFDFDDLFTGPIHGFKDAYDYYARCSSDKFIGDIKIPGLIVNALDDPFLPESCYPFEIVDKNPMVEFRTPKYGGHVGFASMTEKYYWNEKLTLEFVNQHSKIS